MGDLSKNFSDKEFRNKSKKKMCPEFIDRLQGLRDICAHPLSITSGVRTPEENIEVGGAIHSQHLLGTACDISTSNWSAEKRFKLLKEAFSLGFTGIAQGRNFIHLDLRSGKPSTWSY